MNLWNWSFWKMSNKKNYKIQSRVICVLLLYISESDRHTAEVAASFSNSIIRANRKQHRVGHDLARLKRNRERTSSAVDAKWKDSPCRHGEGRRERLREGTRDANIVAVAVILVVEDTRHLRSALVSFSWPTCRSPIRRPRFASCRRSISDSTLSRSLASLDICRRVILSLISILPATQKVIFPLINITYDSRMFQKLLIQQIYVIRNRFSFFHLNKRQKEII